ncbi:MAG: DivIVA domain-containing protein [Clostridia bacterium]|nr:DivIVA domain-containing protein [Clostridia bacterium]
MALLTLDDISNVVFHKSGFGGYKPDEVEDFIDDVEQTVEELILENKKLKELVDHYQSEEDDIKSTLFNARKLAGATMTEAKSKATAIVESAKQKAEEIAQITAAEVNEQNEKLETMKREVSEFKMHLLKLYKEHLKLIDALPKFDDEQTTETVQEVVEAKPKVRFEKIVLNEKSSLEDVKKLLAQPPEDFIRDAMQTDDNIDSSEEINNNLDDDDYDDDFGFLAETKTIKLDAIKFGDDYDISSDEDFK